MNQKEILKHRIITLMNQRPRVIIAMDGMAASGKTTLAQWLCREIPGCFVVHMDDFTIPFEYRFPGYFDQALSNADINRFDCEVLTPLRNGKGAQYRPYRCHPEPGFLPPVHIGKDTACIIVEGAYCLHPDLFDRYDLRILVTVFPDIQRQRILKRNGETQFERFASTWIPMENRHIEARRLHSRCDMIIQASQDF